MATATIVIDPGHGGTGSIGGSDGNHAVSASGVKEKDLTLTLANLVKTELQTAAQAGGHTLNVILTRTGDTNLSLADRGMWRGQSCRSVFEHSLKRFQRRNERRRNIRSPAPG